VSVFSRCALLLALPLDRVGFDTAIRGDELPDYARLLRGRRPPEVEWTERYSRVAAAARDLIAVSSALGVRVFQRATLEHLATATSSGDTVIMLAHWRGSIVSNDDWNVPAEEAYEHLKSMGFGNLTRIQTPFDGVVFTREINAAIKRGTILEAVAPEIAAEITNDILRQTLGRDALDELMGERITPGNCVELYDGQHSVAAFEAALAPGFHGTLELATCISLAPATMIGMRRGTDVRIVHTLRNIDPLPCCLVLAETFRRLERYGGDYVTARLAVEEGLGASPPTTRRTSR
jgi:hypothetical protein